ncbi:hypothetical protein QBC46DRAFT_462210 [Diplogelasinospora grovesii]|uniref:Nephrocystin 3-like N-terminal domain-containing protein n=1 Tax=Diplogelasinospora grovesii TaxID=303347 RepID=A0AAN6MXB6_9PEZI|nr:hypothetical protein QBC46DRAFT_462210 [Diplogelasinospora grovesii]
MDVFRWAKRLKTSHNPPQETSRGPTLPNSGPSKSPPVPSFPDGVEVLHDCPDATVDICFIHGLTGDRESTWTADGQSTPWPKALLPSELNRACILTYGYDAYVLRGLVASSNRLIDHATNLLQDLTTDRARRNASSRPLIFVAHSLGGLICKKAILRSRNNPQAHLRGIFNCTKGIAFMGTPHKGAWMANWAKISVSALGFVKSTNKSLLEILETNNELLESIQIDFSGMIRELEKDGRPLEVTCFFEELPLPMAGLVVSKESATFEAHDPISIHANHRDMVKFPSAKENGFKRLLGELARWESQLDRVASQDRRKALLDSLKFERIDSRHLSIDDAHSKTCEWFLETHEYLDWLDPDKLAQHHGFLWINGKPGAGKSTLMKFAFTHAKKTTEDAAVISFFFNARGEDLEKSTIGMYRSLLHQLLVKLPDLRELLDSSDLDLQSQSGSPTWGIEILRRLFSDATKRLGQRRLTCFVDALDECDESQVQGMVDNFEGLGQCAVETGTQLYICFSSRHYPYIHIQHGRQLTLEAQTGHAEDVGKYVRSKLRVGQSKHIKGIREEILRKADGVFMWVILVVEILNEEFKNGRIFAVKKRLQETPPKLSELFKDILTRDNKNMADLLLCLQWILYAKRPLKREEFYFAVVSGLDPDPEDLAEWDPDHIALDDINRFVLSSSKGLAEITRSKDRTVQFIHESVRDYLIKDGGLRHLWPELGDDFESWSHDRLKKCCQTYIQVDISGCIPPGEALPQAKSETAKDLRQCVSSKFPFLSYATDHILYHANAAASGVSQDDFLKLKYGSDFTSPKGKRPILWALEMGYTTIAMAWIASGEVDLDVKDKDGKTPLSWAAEKGHEAVVKLLLATGQVDADAKSISGGTPLLWAAEKGHEAVVKLLLATGQVDVDAKDDSGRTPLLWAAMNGHEAVVKLLLATGQVDADAKSISGGTPLLWAAEKGHEAVVKLLLATGQVDVDAKDDSGKTPLSWAAEKGHEAVVKLLLATGQVDVDAKSISGWTPLLWAAEKGHEAVVKLLLATGQVDVDAKDDFGWTPLLWAAEKGHEAVVELLLATGQVDVDAKYDSGWTPLSRAAEKGHEAVVKLLLATGQVDVDAKDDSGRTPLLWAAMNGHEAVVKLLLATGQVDADAKSISGWTPLLWAAEKGHEAVVKLLLATGQVDVDAKDDSGWTPLLWAAMNGHEAVVKLLLATGQVDVDAKSNSGWTPLSRAAMNGHEAVNEREAGFWLKTR